jgi:hypothetical protein
MDETYIRAGQAVEMIIKEGPEKAMNCFNG